MGGRGNLRTLDDDLVSYLEEQKCLSQRKKPKGK
jgi:hypothetical protein